MENKLVLYIAASLDGYLADTNGGIGFLEETSASLTDLGYEAFYSRVQAVILGGKTYRQLRDELSPGSWPYEGMPCYVCTRRRHPDDPNVRFTALPPAELLQTVRAKHPGQVWLMGGGETVRSFLRENLIDEYQIYLMPALLGGGIPLFPAGFPKANLRLASCKAIGEVVELIYQRAPAAPCAK